MDDLFNVVGKIEGMIAERRVYEVHGVIGEYKEIIPQPVMKELSVRLFEMEISVAADNKLMERMVDKKANSRSIWNRVFNKEV